MSMDNQWIVNTSDETFAKDVYERSKETLVVLDFWAEWCAPCRALAPILEALAKEMDGAFVLVKANTDANQSAATQFSVQGIPAVFAVLNGEVIESFQGGLPEPEIRAWLQKCEKSVTLAGATRLGQTDSEAAETELKKLAEETPNDPAPKLALLKILLQQRRQEDCLELLEQLESRGFLEPEAERIKAELGLMAKAGGDLASIQAAAAEEPKDFQRQFALAEALAGNEQFQESLELCLELVTNDRQKTGEEARKLMIDVFRVLPEDSELTSEYRRRLSLALY